MFNSGYRGKREQDGRGAINPPAQYVQTIYPQPAITGWSISGSDDTSLDPAGGQTVLVNGSGFAVGVSATLGGSQIVSVTLVNPTQISFTAPANAGGSYTLIVYNSVGGAAILVPGLTYSSVPTWTTAAGSIGSFYETTAISSNVVATADSALTYSLSSGALPSGATLYANGVITGTAPVDSGSTTYTFNITATDAELQDTTRTFTMTINTDVVTWVSPANGTSYTTQANSAISNVSLSATDAAGYGIVYTANSLPTGVSLSGNVIYGTPTTGGNTTTLLTATANTTSRTATNTIYWVVQVGDAYWNLTTLALNSLPVTTPFQSDASLNNFSITVAGDAKAANYNPYQTGYYSNYFDGSGDSLTSPGSTAFTFGASDFTVEYWVYITAVAATYNQHVGAATTSAGFAFGTNASLKMYMTTSITGYTSTGTSFELNKWYHVAYCRSAGIVTFFMNGAVNYSTSASTTITETGLGIGNTPSGTAYPMTGYISNLRVTKGQALYTTAFTPSTTPLTTTSQSATSSNVSLLTCQNNRFVDASVYNFALTKNGDTTAVPANPFTTVYDYGTTYYSTYFDGTGDYLTVPSNAAFSLGTGDFTIEAWIYSAAAFGANGFLLLDSRSAATSTPFTVGINSSGYPYVYDGTSAVAGSSGMSVSTWAHVAWCRSSSTLKMFVNGTSVYSASYTSSLTGAGSLTIGSVVGGGSGYFLTGAISNLRIVKGQALYTTTFTPSTTPLTTTSQGATAANVSLLTCQDSTLIDNSLNAFAITSNGQAQPRPVSPFTTTNYTTASTTIPTLGSGYFDGTGDYLSIADSVALQFGTGNFTVECWVYEPAQSGQYNTVIGKWGSGFGTTGDWSLRTRFNNGTQFAVTIRNTSGWYDIQTNVSVSDNTWHHLAFVRDSTTSIKLYIDGVLKATQAVSSSDIVGSSATMSIGGNIASSTGEVASTGYISNVRIVKGTALYTANFYPGPTPLTAVTNTQLLTVQYNGGSNDSQFQDSSNYQNLITRAGNTTQGTLSPFSATGWSAYFDGNGDYLSITNAAPLRLGSGNFTVEAWIFPTSVTNTYSRAICGTYGYVGLADVGWTFNLRSDGKLSLFMGGSTGTGPTVTSTATIVANVWTHVVAVRSGSTIALYINGTQDGSTSSTKDEDYTSLPFNIGTYRSDNLSPAVGNSGVSFIGWISNLRITKGQALYTTTFTPATSPLTTTSQSATVGNVSLLTLQSPTFIDNSTNRYTITVTGDTKIQSFSPFGPVTVTPYYSNYFDGSGDYLTVTNAAFSLGTGDFTIECWVNYSNKTNSGIFQIGATLFPTVNGIGLGLDNGPNWMLYYGNGSQTAAVTGPTNGTWYHVAVVRSSSVTKVYISGSSIISTADSTNYTGTVLGIAGIYSTSYVMNGYISNFRVTKGLAVYTGTFTPPTAPLAATQSSGTNISAITQASYSNYFDGTGDYLTVSSTAIAAFGFGTSNFTIEGWFYATADNSTDFMIDFRGGVATAPAIFLYTSNQLALYYNGSIVYQPSSLTFVINQWNHVALVRSSNVTKFYLNGTGAGTTYTDNNNYPSAACIIGSDVAAGGSSYWTGYISNIRITKGQALYTTNFTPSTSPLTTTSQGATAANVSLLTCQSSIFSDNSTNSPNAIKVSGDTAISGSNPFGGSTMLLTSQSSTFVDNSVNAFALTVTGDTKPTTIAPFAATTATLVSYTTSVNGGSMYFDGTGDYLTVTNSAFATTGDFTVECWAYVSSAQNGNYGGLFSMRDSSTGYGISLTFLNTGYLEFAALPGGTYSSTAIPFNQWFHIAMIRSGSGSNNVKCFLNGTQLGTITGTATTSTNSGAAIIGRYYANGTSQYFLTGYVSNLRYVVGTALYNASFSPPTAPPTVSAATTLLANSTAGSIIDYTGKNDMETVADARLAPQNPYGGSYYSNYFDGSGDLLTFTATSTFAFGTGNFTVECWVYPMAYGSSVVGPQLFGTTNGSATGYSINLGQDINSFRIISNASGGWADNLTVAAGGGPSLGVWTHIAVVRSGANLTIYKNGVSVATTASAVAWSFSGTNGVVGRFNDGTYTRDLTGYISNLRVVNSALYSTTFTPSTTPLTAVSGTQLLTCQSKTFIDNSTNALAITRTGDVAVNSMNPFQNNGTYSMYFDGTGDYLKTPSSVNYQFGTGDFTIEFWVYLNTVSGNQILYDNRVSAGVYPTIYMGTSTIKYYTNSADRITGGTLTTGQWYYIALCRASGSTKLFVNGTQSGSTYTDANNYLVATLTVGADGEAGGSYLNGYMTDLRVTKYARYTTTFTPPTTTFQTK